MFVGTNGVPEVSGKISFVILLQDTISAPWSSLRLFFETKRKSRFLLYVMPVLCRRHAIFIDFGPLLAVSFQSGDVPTKRVSAI